MRSIWAGAIQFGLINIPVKMYSASRQRRLNLDMIHKTDGCKVGYEYVCKNTGEKVDYKDIVRGYEHENGEYVILTEEDFEEADVEKTHSISIKHFVRENEIDPSYYVKPYYISPDENAAPMYALLREAMQETGKVAVVEYVMRGRERLGILKPEGNAVVLVQIRYKEELKDTEELELDQDIQVDEEQLQMSIELIDRITARFDPNEFEDDYVEELMERIEKKAQGKRPQKKGELPKATDISELMEKLEQSLSKTKKRTSAAYG